MPVLAFSYREATLGQSVITEEKAQAYIDMIVQNNQ
jgi:hypothetical protein